MGAIGTYYSLYCEAEINGKWYNIDFYQRPLGGTPTIVPVIEGYSAVGSALHWYAETEPIQQDDLTDVTKEQGAKQAEDYRWSALYGNWFIGKDLSGPEYSGYFPRQDILNYQSGLSDGLNTEDMLDVEAYLALPDGGKAAYVYYDYTEPWGFKYVMNMIRSAVELRIRACNEWLWRMPKELRGDTHDISWGDVRVIIYQD